MVLDNYYCFLRLHTLLRYVIWMGMRTGNDDVYDDEMKIHNINISTEYASMHICMQYKCVRWRNTKYLTCLKPLAFAYSIPVLYPFSPLKFTGGGNWSLCLYLSWWVFHSNWIPTYISSRSAVQSLLERFNIRFSHSHKNILYIVARHGTETDGGKKDDHHDDGGVVVEVPFNTTVFFELIFSQ